MAKNRTAVHAHEVKHLEAETEEPKIKGFRWDGPAKSYRQCPKCEGYVHAKMKGKCPNPDCDYQIPPAPEKKQKELFHQTPTQNVAMFALRIGGIDKATKALEALKADPVADFAASCGGVSQALEALKALEAQMAIG